MLTTLNTYLTPAGIIAYLKNDVLNFVNQDLRSPKNKNTQLEYLKKRLKDNFFDGMTDEAIATDLKENARFKTYPKLRKALGAVFSLQSGDDVTTQTLDQLKAGEQQDSPIDTNKFDELNAKYGYFVNSKIKKDDLKALFHDLVDACRRVAVLIEQNNSMDDSNGYIYAYKLMALYVNEYQTTLPTVETISQATNKLLSERDKKTEKPFHDVLLVNLTLPFRDEFFDKNGWDKLIKSIGERAFPFFAHAGSIEKNTQTGKAPQTIEEAKKAAALCKYARANEDSDFATLCYSYENDQVSLENEFNQSLDFMASGWPKKTTDSIPNIIVKGQGVMRDGKDIAQGYYWVKLPPSDKRALILGKITDC